MRNSTFFYPMFLQLLVFLIIAKYTLQVHGIDTVNTDDIQLNGFDISKSISVTNLTAESQTTNSINVGWIPPESTEFIAYRVEWSSLDLYGKPTFVGSSLLGNSTIQYNITSLTPGCIYLVSVELSFANSTYSQPTVDSFPTIPATVSNYFVNLGPQTTTLYLTWTDPIGCVDYFMVYYTCLGSETKEQMFALGPGWGNIPAIPGCNHTVDMYTVSHDLYSAVQQANITARPSEPEIELVSTSTSINITLISGEPNTNPVWPTIGYVDYYEVNIKQENTSDFNTMIADALPCHVGNVRPNTNYTAFVTAFVYGDGTNLNSSSPLSNTMTQSGEPAGNFETVNLNINTKSSMHTFDFFLEANVFNDKNGPIYEMLVFVSKPSRISPGSVGPNLTYLYSCEYFEGNVDWEECVAIAADGYGNLLPASARKRRSFDNPIGNPAVSFVIGDETVTQTQDARTQFVNSKLLPDTAYIVAVGARTQDSGFVVTNWSQPIRTQVDVGLVVGLSIMGVVIAVLLIVGGVFFYQKTKTRKKT
uniref:Receptor-type tyrosine-protein phosphatase beta-like n=1 Tax=Phallusia mammillata TaxID=59560 RepID=A0A6F9DQV1_9ASCI|nr:receptor-type tyrosine-protein phosphatase beta-like [Phallusia mammillata]